MGLFTEMLYGARSKRGVRGIFSSGGKTTGRLEYWNSVNRNSEYSDNYAILNTYGSDTNLLASIKEQKSILYDQIHKSNLSKKFIAANNFVKFANQSLINIETTFDKITSPNELYKIIVAYFNAPLAAGQTYGGEKTTYIETNPDLIKTNGKGGISKTQEAYGKELSNIIKQISSFSTRGIPINLVEKLENLLNEANLPTEEGKIIPSSKYGPLKGQEIERLAFESLDANKNNKKLKALWTGSWLGAEDKKMIGEDVIMIDIDIFKNAVQSKSISINNHKIIDIDSLEKMINDCGGSFTLTEELYDALKTAEVFSTQVKSGIKQDIYNASNERYSIALSELREYQYAFQLLQKLREWDNSFQYKKSRGAKNKHKRKGQSEKIQDTNFFATNPRSPILNAMANLSLSKDIIKLDLYRTKEYQLYFTEDGFITLEEYLNKTGKFWQFTHNIDYNTDFISKKRQVSLRQGLGKLAT